MKRRIFNVLAGVSLLLCTATVGMWVRSYLVRDHFTWGVIHEKPVPRSAFKNNSWVDDHDPSIQTIYAGADAELISELGGVSFRYVSILSIDRFPWAHDYARGRSEIYPMMHPSSGFWHSWGIELTVGGDPYLFDDGVTLPYWLLVVLTAAWPVTRAMRFRWRRQQAMRWRLAGHCANCGYDLRATPERCPECGQAAMPAGGVVSSGPSSRLRFRRWRRHLLNITAATLLLLAAFFCVAWVRSYHLHDAIGWYGASDADDNPRQELRADSGMVQFFTAREFSEPADTALACRWHWHTVAAWGELPAMPIPYSNGPYPADIFRHFGIVVARDQDGLNWSATVPYAVLVVVAGVWPIVRLARWLTRRHVNRKRPCG